VKEQVSVADEEGRRCSKCGVVPAVTVLCPSCRERLERQDLSYWQRHDVALRVPAARGATPEAYVKAV
jgi:hypothetical protein